MQAAWLRARILGVERRASCLRSYPPVGVGFRTCLTSFRHPSMQWAPPVQFGCAQPSRVLLSSPWARCSSVLAAMTLRVGPARRMTVAMEGPRAMEVPPAEERQGAPVGAGAKVAKVGLVVAAAVVVRLACARREATRRRTLAWWMTSMRSSWLRPVQPMVRGRGMTQ